MSREWANVVPGHEAVPVSKQHPPTAAAVAGEVAMLAEPAPSKRHRTGPLVSIERNGDRPFDKGKVGFPSGVWTGSTGRQAEEAELKRMRFVLIEVARPKEKREWFRVHMKQNPRKYQEGTGWCVTGARMELRERLFFSKWAHAGSHGVNVGATLGDLHASPLAGRSQAVCRVEHRRTVVILLLALDAGDN